MSQPKKRDIADFFRAHARPIDHSRKRKTPDTEDNDTIVVRERSSDRTPSTARYVNNETFRLNSRTPSKSSISPLATPKSGRSVSIAYRSPSISRVSEIKPTKPTSLSIASNKSSEPSSQGPSPFVFADAPNSSRKIIENGKLVAVRDSDESDNESLGSLTDIFDRKSNDLTGSSAEPTSSARQEDERINLLSMYTGGRSNPIVNRERMRQLQRQERENKFDLSSILEENRKEEETRARIAQIEAELEEATRDIEKGKQKDLDKKLLASILQGDAKNNDPAELARLMNAVDRTEALSGERSFSFFDEIGPRDLTKVKRKTRSFPADIPGQLWQPKDTAARERMYVSGFMTELASRGRLSDQVLRWTYDSIPYEEDEDLRSAYLNCVVAASSSWTRANITPEDIQDAFVVLGGDQIAIRDSTAIELRRRQGSTNKKHENRSLLATVTTFDAICQDMDFPTLSKLVSLVCRLCLDQNIMVHNQTMEVVESLLRKLADLPDLSSRQHVHERILSDLSSNIKEPTLQVEFISHFMPASPSGTKFRVTLAATFLLGSNRANKIFKPHPGKPPLVALLNHIFTSPTFRITPETDFETLAASVALLDTIISSGHPPPLHTRADENIFNAQVDELADKIRDLFTSIADAGASHMKKTEAKDTLQALHNRILFAIRTRVRRKKHVFDNSETSVANRRVRDAEDVMPESDGRDFMRRFLKRPDLKEEEFVDVVEV